MSDDIFDSLSEIVPIATATDIVANDINREAARFLAIARRHDRLVEHLRANRIKGATVAINVTTTATTIATDIPKGLQMDIVESILKYYRDEALRLHESIQKLKEDL